jgi:hypothetical protein
LYYFHKKLKTKKNPPRSVFLFFFGGFFIANPCSRSATPGPCPRACSRPAGSWRRWRRWKMIRMRAKIRGENHRAVENLQVSCMCDILCTGGVSYALFISLLISKLFCTKGCTYVCGREEGRRAPLPPH